jgi:hypothetical protein
MEFADELKLLQLILYRLERIPVDSRLAHRASGLRGSLLAIIDNIDKRQTVSVPDAERLINQGFYLLERAAAERVQRGSSSKT